MQILIDDIIRDFGGALLRGEGAYFLGSGISVDSGLPDWFELIQRLAIPLGLTLTKQDNLPRIAQYCVNANNGNRGPLIGRLKRALSQHTIKTNSYHVAINRTNVRTIWTTNFDTLIEAALQPARLVVRANDADLTSGLNDFDVELIKIHGCISRSKPSEFVLTQEDYENFASRRPALAERLRHDLIHKSLLFAGYSYNDPNIETVVVEARRLSGGATREHYFILKKATNPQAYKRQELWQDDLSRFGIRTAFISDYDELKIILNRLSLASRGKSVFVTGSHTNNNSLAAELGRLLAHEANVIFLDGQSTGIGRDAANAYGAECVNKRVDIRDRVRHFPNPYSFNPSFANDPTLLNTLKQWRASLARAAHSIVVFDGGMGTNAEIELAREMGCVIIPVPGRPKGTASRLLADSDITNRLDPNYIAAASSGMVTAGDIIACLRATFSS
ncbi:MAG: SIR2 family protein [Acidobacteriota bacterium]|nr:SIR2 family protein [Acidobacteriota bacterium]